MSGYKSSALAYGPKLFLTFDGDAFDSYSRQFTSVPSLILDESGEENHAILHDSGVVSGFPGHRAGEPSLVDLEPGGQYAASFGYYGRRTASPNLYEKAYLEVPSNASSFEFPDNGQFTVMFLLQKENATQYRADNGVQTLTRPIMRKTGVFTCNIVYHAHSTNVFEVTNPDGEKLSFTLPTSWFSVNHHIAITWRAGVYGVDNILSGTMTLYMDGIAVATKSTVYPSSLPVTNVNSAIYIGGVPEAATYYSDRQTEDCRFDQIAIYDFAMSGPQVTRMYRKMLSYRNMIIRSVPTCYWECGEDETLTTDILVATLSNSNIATMTGGSGKASRGTPGPDQVPSSKAVSVDNGGQIYFRNGTNTATAFSIASDYTVEFWFKCTSTTIASLFSMVGTQYPFAGLNMTVNLGDNQFQSGSIQVQESETEWLTATGSWNDGNFHHLAVVKVGAVLSIWIDGTRRAFKELTARSTAYPGTASMFGTSPGRLACAGAASNIAWYTRGLQEQEITARSNYQKIYKIRGRVTLRGVPYKANVRVYSHLSGTLMQEIFSNSSDGEYLAELYDNRLIDLVVMNSQDPSIRYRVYGPVTPSEYEDLA